MERLTTSVHKHLRRVRAKNSRLGCIFSVGAFFLPYGNYTMPGSSPRWTKKLCQLHLLSTVR